MEKSKEKSTKTNMQKRDRTILIAIIAVVTIAVIVIVIFAVKAKKDDMKKGGTDNNPGTQQQSNEPVNTENVEVKTDGTKENNSSKLKEDKEFEGMAIKDIKLNAQGGLTNFTAKVENKTGKDFDGKPVIIVFTGKDGKEVSTLEAYVGQTKAGGSSMIDASATADLSNAFDFSIKSKD
ncbi:MAG: hypothetical protein RSE00_01045 [Clostridia bacterium]